MVIELFQNHNYMSIIIIYCLLAAVVALVAGLVVGRQLAGKTRQDLEGQAQAKAQQILQEAEEKGSRDRKSTRLNSSHSVTSRMPSSA